MTNEIIPHEPGNVISFSDAAKYQGLDSPHLADDEKSESSKGPKWLAEWITDDKGNPITNLHNVMVVLRNDAALNNALVFDEMLGIDMLMVPLSGAPNPQQFSPRPVDDHDITRIQEYLQCVGLDKVSKGTVRDAVELRARENPFHPIQDYLGKLHWDGQKRVEKWMPTYLHAESTPYTERVGVMFLVAMIARVLKPGCKFDYMLVLEGKQGARKSTACAILGGEFYSDHLPDVSGGKDVSQFLPGKWVIEVPELSALTNTEKNRLKAFITRQTEQYRPSYGRKQVAQQRQCVLIGTTNESSYLRDETGNRRFWPVKVGMIDTDALRKDRDQLLAEALHLFSQGTSWHPDREFEREHILPEQESRLEPDPWEDTIREYLLATKPERVYLSALLENPLHIEPKLRRRAQQNRVAGILVRLGWTRLKKDSKGYFPWGPPS